ncbi:hypothetical protein Hanom_Chr10g00960171 [Helianthus anomalus]
MRMTRFQTIWIRLQKNKPLDESCKTDQTTGTKMAIYSNRLLANFQPVQRVPILAKVFHLTR